MVRMGDGNPQVWYAIVEEMEAKLKHLEFQGDDILLDWRKAARKRRIDREIFEKYGYFKDIILHPRFQMVKHYFDEYANFDLLVGEPIMPLPTAIIILFMMQRRVSNSIIGLAAAFIFNFNPLYVAVFMLFIWLMGFNRKPKQYIKKRRAHQIAALKQKQSSSVGLDKSKVLDKYDHVLVGSDISTLYTAALLSQCGHSCFVMQPKHSAKLEVQ
jgi:hypothetical protein